jgi:hypothetical protein
VVVVLPKAVRKDTLLRFSSMQQEFSLLGGEQAKNRGGQKVSSSVANPAGGF